MPPQAAQPTPTPYLGEPPQAASSPEELHIFDGFVELYKWPAYGLTLIASFLALCYTSLEDWKGVFYHET